MHGQITPINSQQQGLITVQVQLRSRAGGHTHPPSRARTRTRGRMRRNGFLWGGAISLVI